MSGGGKKVSKGRMSSKVQSEFSAADVRKMETQLETDAKELEVRISSSNFWYNNNY